MCRALRAGRPPRWRGGPPARVARPGMARYIPARLQSTGAGAVRVSDMNWMQVEAYLKRDDRAVLPIGSTEQHS